MKKTLLLFVVSLSVFGSLTANACRNYDKQMLRSSTNTNYIPETVAETPLVPNGAHSNPAPVKVIQ